MASSLAREKAAQAWCKPETERITMDTRLAEAFANILDEVWGALPEGGDNCEVIQHTT